MTNIEFETFDYRKRKVHPWGWEWYVTTWVESTILLVKFGFLRFGRYNDKNTKNVITFDEFTLFPDLRRLWVRVTYADRKKRIFSVGSVFSKRYSVFAGIYRLTDTQNRYFPIFFTDSDPDVPPGWIDENILGFF